MRRSSPSRSGGRRHRHRHRGRTNT
jgi:hypothetical protein